MTLTDVDSSLHQLRAMQVDHSSYLLILATFFTALCCWFDVCKNPSYCFHTDPFIHVCNVSTVVTT